MPPPTRSFLSPLSLFVHTQFAAKIIIAQICGELLAKSYSPPLPPPLPRFLTVERYTVGSPLSQICEL